jgi:ABC-type glycerol-3-phosphate transport system permease component
MRRNRVNRAGLLELGADLVVIAFVLFSTLPILWLFLTSLKPEEEIVTRSLR